MNTNSKLIIVLTAIILVSCGVSKDQYALLETELASANENVDKYGKTIQDYSNRLATCDAELERLKGLLASAEGNLAVRQDQVDDLKDQISDMRSQRDQQTVVLSDLTTLSQSASDNIKETLSQLEGKDRYIGALQAAKSRADSVNLALAVNLKSVLAQGINDNDVEVKVDKTVVFVNLSDKMTYTSGSSNLTPRAKVVLGKIAQILKSRPDLEVMVEGYTDNVSIRNSCIMDNWDLSVRRATSVVRTLQKEYGVDPNKLIAAGRGEYNILASNETKEGREMNRRTRVIILPKLDQFYDLLNPAEVPN